MNPIAIVIIGFLLLEGANVAALYFFPDSKQANSVGVFSAWERSKADPELHRFVRYLVNWVAGTKLIFLLLLIVILATAGERTLIAAGLAMAVSIASFFWRLFPLVGRMDQAGQVEPPGYSRMLGRMILAMVMLFLGAAVWTALE